MRQNILYKLFSLGLAVLVLFTVNCGKLSTRSDKEVLDELTKYLNSRMHGGSFEIDPADAIVKPIGNDRYRIKLKNTVFVTDLIESVKLLYKYLSTDDDFYSYADGHRMEEMNLVYGPGENYLELISIKGLNIESDLSRSKGSKRFDAFGGFEPDKARISIGKITLGYPESIDMISSETVEHLKLQLSGETAKKDKISFLLDIRKIGKVDTGKEDDTLSNYLMDRNAPVPDLQIALDKGAAINDLNVQLGKVSILIKKNGGILCEGAIENAAYLQFMKPDENGKAFKFGHGIKLKNLELSIPGEKKLQLVSNIKDFFYEFSIKNLSPAAALTFLDLTRNSFALRNQGQGPAMNEYMSLATKMIFDVMNSKTHLEFKIKPFKHYFGEMEAAVDIRLYNLVAGPLVTVKVTLFNWEDIFSKLKQAGIFPGETLTAIWNTLEKHAKKKENGDATIIYEMDIHQVRQMFFGGNPLPPTSNYNTLDILEP